MADDPVQLVVFADDWGRHPSSAQHLVRHLLPQTAGVLWVNTIGTRRPRLTVRDLLRGLKLVANWFYPPGTVPQEQKQLPPGLRVMAPKMYPGFRNRWQRGLNARLLARAVERPLASVLPRPSGGTGPRRVAVTTLPITADLVGRVPGVDRWVYYCVDDFSVWPGLDGGVMDAMERELVAKVDAVVAVSETLVERVRSMGRQDVTLLTHGVDVDHWTKKSTATTVLRPGAVYFWGLLDGRMDAAWVTALTNAGRSLWINGLRDATTSAEIARNPDVLFLGHLEYEKLPASAAIAGVLVMPYIDAPVTRAMQPLKLLEYLATYKPVVVRDLPATRAWADCCDVVSTAEEFVRVCLERAETGLPPEQRAARERRLPAESWSAKAGQLAAILRDDGGRCR